MKTPTISTKKKECKKSRRGNNNKKPVANKYNGVTLPTDSTERRRLRNKLSAEVYRKRKQDALKTAKEDVEQRDAEMDKLNVQLNDTRSRISHLQSTMKALEEQLGSEMVQHILQQCNMSSGIMSTMIVTSDSETNASSSLSLSSSDDEYNL